MQTNCAMIHISMEPRRRWKARLCTQERRTIVSFTCYHSLLKKGKKPNTVQKLWIQWLSMVGIMIKNTVNFSLFFLCCYAKKQNSQEHRSISIGISGCCYHKISRHTRSRSHIISPFVSMFSFFLRNFIFFSFSASSWVNIVSWLYSSRLRAARTLLEHFFRVCFVWFSCSLFYSIVLLPRFFHFAWKHRYTDGWTQNSAHKNLYDCMWWWWLYAWTANKRKEQNEEEKNERKAYENEMKPKNNNNKKTIIETVYVRR